MKLSLGSDVCMVSLYGRIESTEVSPLFVHSYLCHEPLVVGCDAEQFEFASCWRAMSILQIRDAGHITQIGPCVVAWIPIDVVYVIDRELSNHPQKGKAVNVIPFTIDADLLVAAIRANTTSLTACNDGNAPVTTACFHIHQPSENASGLVVRQKRPQALCGQCLHAAPF